MKTERNILIAFLLNLAFSAFELVGGIFTGSAAIVSDAVHDAGDAVSIGLSYILEKKSKRRPDETCTYGYARYSVLGSLLTTVILFVGSAVAILHAISRMIRPEAIHYNGMIAFAVVGVAVNLAAAFFTREGGSLNQRAVNLHMLEDVLGWIVVLAGAVVMRFTGLDLLDPIMSVGVSGFILFHAVGNLRDTADVLLEKAPRSVRVQELREHLEAIDGVEDVHHMHLWSLDGQNHYATLHVTAHGEMDKIKEAIRAELKEHGIGHVTIETEAVGETCRHRTCSVEAPARSGLGHHHHHHH